MEPKTPITALIQTVEKLLTRFQDSRRENAQLRLENATLQQKLSDYRLTEEQLQQTIAKLEYKNDLAKAKVESIISRLQAIDAGLQETAEARAAAHTLAQTALYGQSTDLSEHNASASHTTPPKETPQTSDQANKHARPEPSAANTRKQRTEAPA